MSRSRAILASLVVLAALGCARSHTSSPASAPIVGGVSGYFGPPSPGAVAPRQSWPGISTTKLSPDPFVAPVGSSGRLEVLVRDDYGSPVHGAQVMFAGAPRGSAYGLGSTFTDATGKASVLVIPAVVGSSTVVVDAWTAHSAAPVVTFGIGGKP